MEVGGMILAWHQQTNICENCHRPDILLEAIFLKADVGASGREKEE
jgi:hypothetical protein